MADRIDDILEENADREAAAQGMAQELTKGRWHWLMIFAGGVFACGAGLAAWQGEGTTFARSGALITCLSLVHGFSALRYSTLEAPSRTLAIDVRAEIEKMRSKELDDAAAKARAQIKVDAVVPRMFAAVARQFAAQNLLIAAFGTLVWGFGDLLPFGAAHALLFSWIADG